MAVWRAGLHVDASEKSRTVLREMVGRYRVSTLAYFVEAIEPLGSLNAAVGVPCSRRSESCGLAGFVVSEIGG